MRKLVLFFFVLVAAAWFSHAVGQTASLGKTTIQYAYQEFQYNDGRVPTQARHQ